MEGPLWLLAYLLWSLLLSSHFVVVCVLRQSPSLNSEFIENRGDVAYICESPTAPSTGNTK